MEYFFENNIYIIFAIITLSFLCKPNYNDNKKIVIIYLFITMLAIFKILDLKIMLIIFLICFFLYFEFLIDDEFKLIIIKNFIYKIFDFIYLLTFKYLFIFYILDLFIISTSFSHLIYLPPFVKYSIFIIIFIIIISFITNNDFELTSFTKMVNKLNSKVDFGKYPKLDNDKKNILLFIEDRSFFDRPHSYTILCWDYIKYRINKINEVIQKIDDAKGRHHKIKNIWLFLKYAFKQIKKQMQDIPRFWKRIFYGHSTIEMQVFRSIAVKSGYTKKHLRKIAEIFYTPIFFRGLKNYYKLNNQKVSDIYYKNYILACYSNFSLVFYKGQRYANYYEFFKHLKTINNTDFLLYVLCLSSKLDRLNKEKLLNYYGLMLGLNKKDIAKSLKRLPK